ncbi:MAG TPA: hypothetical protein VFI24_20695 [Pyrinomonadaceae bacterium]|nr:hypothetical protein [Pyrinomonadaceae bacterium]
MLSHDQAISEYYSLKPTAFTTVARLELRQHDFNDGSPPELALEIELLADNGGEKSLLLSFEGVRELKIQQPSLSLFQIPFIEIRSIQDSQWEKLNYKVQSENDSISFFCRSFSSELVFTGKS